MPTNELTQLAKEYMKHGRIFDATKIWRTILEREENNRLALFFLAVCYFATSKYGKAFYFFQKAHSLGYPNCDKWLKRAEKKLLS